MWRISWFIKPVLWVQRRIIHLAEADVATRGAESLLAVPGSIWGDWNRPLVVELPVRLFDNCRPGKQVASLQGSNSEGAAASIGAGGRQQKEKPMKKWQCVVCGLIYDEAKGWPDDGIAPGTRWEDVPEDWVCPDCGVGKEDFEMIEVS